MQSFPGLTKFVMVTVASNSQQRPPAQDLDDTHNMPSVANASTAAILWLQSACSYSNSLAHEGYKSGGARQLSQRLTRGNWTQMPASVCFKAVIAAAASQELKLCLLSGESSTSASLRTVGSCGTGASPRPCQGRWITATAAACACHSSDMTKGQLTRLSQHTCGRGMGHMQ